MATDILSDLKTLLDNDWTAGNTGGRTPTVTKIYEVKRADFEMAGSKDHIFIYSNTSELKDNAAGGGSKEIIRNVTVDVRTMLTRDQVLLLVTEVERIIQANEVDPFSDGAYDIADVTDENDLSDKFVKLFRIVLKLKFEDFNC